MSPTPKFSGYPNVPAPEGSKAGTAYQRFIPREELGDVTSWRPGALGPGRERLGANSSHRPVLHAG